METSLRGEDNSLRKAASRLSEVPARIVRQLDTLKTMQWENSFVIDLPKR